MTHFGSKKTYLSIGGYFDAKKREKKIWERREELYLTRTLVWLMEIIFYLSSFKNLLRALRIIILRYEIGDWYQSKSLRIFLCLNTVRVVDSNIGLILESRSHILLIIWWKGAYYLWHYQVPCFIIDLRTLLAKKTTGRA